MPGDEIEVPKELFQFMSNEAEETFLGQKNGANKQYRYGNLHIREYDDKFLVHTDHIDPRKNALGHLVVDAPEVLIGLACAAIGGTKVAKLINKNQKNSLFRKQNAASSGFLASVIAGYLGYSITKLLKKQ